MGVALIMNLPLLKTVQNRYSRWWHWERYDL